MNNLVGTYNTCMHCTPETFTIAKLNVERHSIDEKPPYQRESGAWSLEKQQLFIDSLLNGFDIPKIYFHDLRNGKKQLKKYALVDGKQRLSAIYNFLENIIPLADDFKINEDTEYEKVKAGMYFKDFEANDFERFKAIGISISLIQDATEEDIEELFFRLNNGEPLNAAEKRNNINGDMTELIRTIAKTEFFKEKLGFINKRFSHYEVSAKFLLLEKNQMGGGDYFSDLKKKFLDKMAKENRKMTEIDKVGITKRVTANLSLLNNTFLNNDVLLSKQAYPPLYYLFVKLMNAEYGHKNMFALLRNFLDQFQTKRIQNLELPEDNRDPALDEFTRLMQQGTNDLSSLKNRVSILRRYFLYENPDVKILDKKRFFTDEERLVIYKLAGEMCSECHIQFSNISEMEADHIEQHIFGGETILANARALCIKCNKKLKENRK